MPVDTIIAQVQDGKKVVGLPARRRASQGTSYRPVPPWAWEKK